jgi:Protein kinase domain
MTPGDVGDKEFTPGPRTPNKERAPSPQNGYEAGAVIALEPSAPTRMALRRLRVALAVRGAIDHPNLIRSRRVGEGDGRVFVAFERCPHPSLTELLAAAPLQPAECARILDGAAAGVDALSQRGLFARDLAPDRVLVDAEHGGVLMVLGIPRELLRRVPLGQDHDLAFRSPEELERQPVDLRSSVYSLGAVLFTALTGLPPADPWARIGEPSPRPTDQRPELPPEIDEVVARAMARDPAVRYSNPERLSRATAAALGAHLAPMLAGRGLKPNERQRQRLARRSAGRNGSRPTKENSSSPPAPLVAQEPQIDRSPGSNVTGSRLGDSATTAAAPAIATSPSEHGHRPAAAGTAGPRAFRYRRILLLAVGAIVASALSGIALGLAFEPEERPTSVTGSGLTLQLPRGWEPADRDLSVPAFPAAIAAVPPGTGGAGFVAGKFNSLIAAEQILERLQRDGDGRTRVRLGGTSAWQYAGLRPRRNVVGTGYLVPTAGGAVVGICHASRDEAPVRLAQCKRAATTLVIRGEQPLQLSSADRSNERMIRAVGTLRASRSEGRRRLEAAELARGQVRAAASLRNSHQRASRSFDRISALESGFSLGDLSAAARQLAVAYGRLADAARTTSRSEYREARTEVARGEAALRRELARTGAG